MTATTNSNQPRRWYNDRELFLHGFVRSNYVTSFTDWFMSLTGKATELVLYATVLYSCAQLYPGVHLPTGLSLAVFLIQMGALDIGGLSLGKLAKQAREDGNTAGALNADTLSKWLIGIMLVGVVTVGLEHALPFALPEVVTVSIDVVLVIGRSIAAVLYGRVVHDLKQDAARLIPEAEVQATIEHFQEQVTQQAQELTTTFTQQLQLLATELAGMEQRVQLRLADVEKRTPAIDLETLVEAASAQIETRLQAKIEAFLSKQVAVLPVHETLQTAAPSTVSRTHKRDSKAHKPTLTARGKSAGDGDPETVVSRLLDEDASRTHRVIAKMTGIPDTTVYRIRKRYLEERGNSVSPEPEADETAM